MCDCIFCKIANGEFNTEFVYETNNIVVFKDINPVSPVHLLVVPKKHYEDLNKIDDKNLLSEIMETIQKVTKKLNIESYRTVINTGKEAGQEVFHMHVHIISGRKLQGLG